MSDHDTSKLPKWARQRIESLERNLDRARATLSAGPEDSDVFADPYGAAPRPLGKHVTVRFHLGDGRQEYVDVRIESSKLCIHGGDVLALLPRAANSLDIQVVKP